MPITQASISPAGYNGRSVHTLDGRIPSSHQQQLGQIKTTGLPDLGVSVLARSRARPIFKFLQASFTWIGEGGSGGAAH